MEWGQQMKRHEQVSRDATFHNTNYMNNREKKIPLVLDIHESSGENGLSGGNFKIDLIEPLIIDELSDIYLDSCITKNTKLANKGASMGFVIKIDQFNINSRSNNANINGGFLIPNEHNNHDNHNISVPHKSKKMNYICSINPTKLSQLTGTITNLSGDKAFAKKAHFVEIVALVEAIPVGITITTGDFIGKTSANHALGATRLFFDELTIGTVNLNTSLTFAFSGYTSKATVANTHIAGVPPKMILELLIVNRSK